MGTKKRKTIIIFPILIIMLSWFCIVITDYVFSINAQAPVFARKIKAYDADIYRGMGYTIIIDDGFAVSPPDSELKVYFYWGWR